MNKEELKIKTVDKVQKVMFKLTECLDHMTEADMEAMGREMDIMADMLDGKEND